MTSDRNDQTNLPSPSMKDALSSESASLALQKSLQREINGAAQEATQMLQTEVNQFRDRLVQSGRRRLESQPEIKFGKDGQLEEYSKNGLTIRLTYGTEPDLKTGIRELRSYDLIFRGRERFNERYVATHHGNLTRFTIDPKCHGTKPPGYNFSIGRHSFNAFPGTGKGDDYAIWDYAEERVDGTSYQKQFLDKGRPIGIVIRIQPDAAVKYEIVGPRLLPADLTNSAPQAKEGSPGKGDAREAVSKSLPTFPPLKPGESIGDQLARAQKAKDAEQSQMKTTTPEKSIKPGPAIPKDRRYFKYDPGTESQKVSELKARFSVHDQDTAQRVSNMDAALAFRTNRPKEYQSAWVERVSWGIAEALANQRHK